MFTLFLHGRTTVFITLCVGNFGHFFPFSFFFFRVRFRAWTQTASGWEENIFFKVFPQVNEWIKLAFIQNTYICTICRICSFVPLAYRPLHNKTDAGRSERTGNTDSGGVINPGILLEGNEKSLQQKTALFHVKECCLTSHVLNILALHKALHVFYVTKPCFQDFKENVL